jgi:hypothetical protein
MRVRPRLEDTPVVFALGDPPVVRREDHRDPREDGGHGVPPRSSSADSLSECGARRRGRLFRPRAHDDLAVDEVDLGVSALRERTEQDLVRQPFLHVLLDHAAHLARPELGFVALVQEELPGGIRRRQRDVALGELLLELEQELVDDEEDDLFRQVGEHDGRVEPVAELGREHVLEHRVGAGGAEVLREPEASSGLLACAALVVRITMAFRKSVFRPLLSVRFAESMIWSRMLNTSGWAFSISSRTTTQCGVLCTASVSSPPCSNPT